MSSCSVESVIPTPAQHQTRDKIMIASNLEKQNIKQERCNNKKNDKSLPMMTTSSSYSIKVMPIIMLPLMLMIAVGSTSAFAPHSVISPTKHTSNSRIRINTKLHAGGKTVPKMPTLPISTTPTQDNYSTTTTSSSPNNKQSTDISTMVVMDVENIRGATSFRISHEALLTRIRLWREDRLSMGQSSSGKWCGAGESFLEPLIWICDHGRNPSIHHFSSLSSSSSIASSSRDDEESNGNRKLVEMPHNFGTVFAGPGRTADDVIVDLVELRCGGAGVGGRLNSMTTDSEEVGEADDKQQPIEPHLAADSPSSSASRNTTIVITADAKLISRCQQARRKSSSLSDVIFVEPASLLQQLERYRINSVEEEALFGAVSPPSLVTTTPPARNSANINLDEGGRSADGKTSTMTSFKDSTIAMQQHAKFQARFGKKKGSSTPDNETESKAISTDATAKEDEEGDEVQSPSKPATNNSAALAAQLQTEQIRRQLLLSDAYYLARPSKNRGRRAQSTVAAVHAKYKNRNISKKQQKKLFAKRFGKKRKEDMVQAAMRRKELALKLQMNLGRVDTTGDEFGEIEVNIFDEADMLLRSMRLLDTLLGRFEEERLIRSSPGNAATGSFDTGTLTTTSSTSPTPVLGLDGSTPGRMVEDKWDPLGSTLSVPLRKEVQQTTADNNNLPPLRVVVISDTHGFEGGLSRFADPTTKPNNDESPGDSHHVHGDEYLLPQADVLLHCGDFAASGSRKTQRQAARRLDDFLARQTHIPEKIVIKGNHDPDSPAKVLFPHSKALYVRSSSTLMVNGVSLTLEPYSRRMAFRSFKRKSSSYTPSSLPKCDVLVSHEPPKGVLDLTYHGFSAGSLYLRELVEDAEHKPRLWLCGHIHESRGVVSKQFQPSHGPSIPGEENNKEGNEDASSTMVINASNANSGRANRLVMGAVVVDIERHVAGAGDETAESTLKSHKRDMDGFDSLNGSDGSDTSLSGLGEELEVYVTRPGVRRRKGIPRSVRQQMKGVRSTLLANASGEE